MSRGIAGLQNRPSQRGGPNPSDAQDEGDPESEPPDLSSRLQSLPSRERASRLTVTPASGRLENREEENKQGYDAVSSERPGISSTSQVSGAGEQYEDHAHAGGERQGHQSLPDRASGRRDRGRGSKAASCTNCRARKVRCDKVKPCSQCVLRGIGHTCSATPLIGSSTFAPQEHLGRETTSYAEATRPRQLSEPFTSVQQRISGLSAPPGTASIAANPPRGFPTTPSRLPQTASQASRISIESRLASLERKFDRLSAMVERLTTGRSSHNQSSVTSAQQSEPFSTRYGSTFPDTLTPTLPQPIFSGRTPFQTIQESQLQQEQQQQEQQQQQTRSTRERRIDRESTSSNFAARPMPGSHEPVTFPSVQSLEPTMETRATSEARQSPYRAYRQAPSSLYNAPSILERRSDETPFGSDEAHEAHPALREHESQGASALLPSSLNDQWGPTSNLATLSLDEGDETAQDTSTPSFR